MRVTLQRPAATKCDGEVIALGVLLLSGAFGAAWLTLGLPTPACLFHAATGLPCPTCGGTRCLRNLLGGHVATALGWNPLVFSLAVAAAGFVIYAALVTAFRLPRIRIGSFTSRETLALRIGVICAAAANWIYVIFRFSRGA